MISGATIHGLLVPTGTAVPSVANVEVEIYQQGNLVAEFDVEGFDASKLK